MQKSKTNINYQYAFDEMGFDDPKDAEKTKQQEEAALKLQKVIQQC